MTLGSRGKRFHSFQDALDQLTARNRSVADVMRFDAPCPHCHVFASFDRRFDRDDVLECPATWLSPDVFAYSFVLVFTCKACDGVVLIGSHAVQQPRESAEAGDPVDVYSMRLLWPIGMPLSALPAVVDDQELVSAFDEARAVWSISPRSAATLARWCIQHILRTRLHIRMKTLFDEIEAAKQSDELSKVVRARLHHVRELGNRGAHPTYTDAKELTNIDPIADQAITLLEVSAADAVYTLEVVQMLVQELFVVPVQSMAMEARLRASKKS